MQVSNYPRQAISHPKLPTITELFQSTAFDPETVKLLCDAYDRARQSLHDTGQPDIVNEVIAKRIISLAQQGERDPDKLCEGALAALGKQSSSDL